MISQSVHRNRAMALIATTFGLFVGLLAMIGVYGVTSHAAAEGHAKLGFGWPWARIEAMRSACYLAK